MECPYCKNTVIIPEALRASPPSQAGAAPSATPAPLDLAEIRRLMRAGQKIEAVRLLRQSTDLGLPEAVHAVEAIARGEQVTVYASLPEPLPGITPDLEPALRSLLQSRQRVEAIRLLRERLDLSLKTADTTLALLATGLPLDEALQTAAARSAAERLPAPATAPAELTPNARRAALFGAGGCSLFAVFIFIVGFIVPLVAVGAALLMPDGPLGELGARLNPLGYARLELAFGEEGEAQGYFEDLRLLALAPDGSLYTAEYETGRIQHLSGEGEFLNLWFVPGTEYMDEVYLQDLEVAPDGRLVAVARGEIFIYEGDTGTLLQNFKPSLADQTYSVDALAFSPDGTPYALVDGETLLRFSASWEPELLGEDIIYAVTRDSESSASLALDGSGFAYVLGTFNQSVFRYDREGAYLNRFGSQGEEKGQFTYAQNLAIDRYGRVVVADSAGILLFDADGRFLRQFAIPGVAFDLAIDAQNRLWLATNHQRVLVYSLPAP
jgi:ribosomal protein L7/L12